MCQSQCYLADEAHDRIQFCVPNFVLSATECWYNSPQNWKCRGYVLVDILPVQQRLCDTCDIHRKSKKTRHLTLAQNLTKYWPIFKILSLLDSVGNLQQSYVQIPHHTLNVSLHYLVKYLCSKNRHS